MIAIITILIVVACAALAFFILIQNPKGGGLSGSFGSISSQVMGVKQSGDVMEKGTWVLIGAIAFLCIVSVTFAPKQEGAGKNSAAAQQSSAPAKKGK